MQMTSKTVEVYRLWPDSTWDKVKVTAEVPVQMAENVEFIELKAVENAWFALLATDKKPIQIGLLMASVYGVKDGTNQD